MGTFLTGSKFLAVRTVLTKLAFGPGVATGVTGTPEKSIAKGVGVRVIGLLTKLARIPLPKTPAAAQLAAQKSMTLSTPLMTRQVPSLRLRSPVAGIETGLRVPPPPPSSSVAGRPGGAPPHPAALPPLLRRRARRAG